MADNRYRAFGSHDSIAPDYQDMEPGDPLEELARLIGQSDPIGDVARGGRASQRDVLTQVMPGAPASDWGGDDEQYIAGEPYGDEANATEEPQAQLAAPGLADPYPPAFHDPQSFAAAERVEDYDRLGGDERAYDHDAAAYDDSYQHPAKHDAAYREPIAHDAAPPLARRRAPALPPQAHEAESEAAAQWDDQVEPRSQRVDPSEGTDSYDDAPQPRRRPAVMALAALAVLVVVGAASAYGYRAVFGGSILPTLPPIIKAADGPNKIVPPRADSGKAAVADAGSGEKLVSREEQPVHIQTPNVTPHVVETVPVLPSAPSATPFVAPGAGAIAQMAPGALIPAAPSVSSTSAPPVTGAAPAATSSTAPKKIHTLSIHPDQLGTGRVTAAAPAAPPPASLAAAPAAVPTHVSAPPPPAAAKPSHPPLQRAEKGGPLAIVPAAEGEAHTAELTRPRSAEPTRAEVAHAEARPLPLPSAPTATASSGGYAVQVTSQRSEAEAQAEYRALRSKYPAQLGNRTPIIRRADLGDKGTFYRAMVGPFASREAAAQICSSIKAAGGSCLVQKE